GQETFFISCAPHVVPWLKQELDALGYKPFDENYTGLFIKAAFERCMELNFQLTTASRVLWLVDKFTATDQKQLYNKLSRIRWSDYFSEKKYITITS
ncbi:THUMP domain-containing protein, partial [Escherichia coli]|uniref:THUMP domain-containing protein n=1 Tax=Escherichia coli TaxID=562 RepID=UPI00200E81C5